MNEFNKILLPSLSLFALLIRFFFSLHLLLELDDCLRRLVQLLVEQDIKIVVGVVQEVLDETTVE